MVRFLVVLLTVGLLTGCDNAGDNKDGFSLEAKTIMTSSNLGAGKKAAPRLSESGTEVFTSPENVSGEAVSLLFAIANVSDEGIVIFGEPRPDIAPANSPSFAFDFAAALPILSTPSFDPSRPGGDSEHMVIIFSYLDIVVDAGGQFHTVRIALASNDGMQRGDKLLLVGGTFQWYDLDTSSFTSTRPSNPARIVEIEQWFDPIFPNMNFYSFNVFMSNTALSLLTADLATASLLDINLAFDVFQMVVFENTTSLSGMTPEDVIVNFNVSQVVSGLGDSGLGVLATVVIVP